METHAVKPKEKEGFVPLEQLLKTHVKDRQIIESLGDCDEVWRNNFMNAPFKFFGGYVRLSAQELNEYCESETIQHYKDLTSELIQSKEHLKSEIDGMQLINDSLEDKVT